MKKKIIIIALIVLVSALLLLLIFCKKAKLDKNDIKLIRGMSQNVSPPISGNLSEEEIDDFADHFNSMKAVKTGRKNKKKGWLYSFSVILDEGEELRILVIDKFHIEINGDLYFALLGTRPGKLDELFSD